MLAAGCTPDVGADPTPTAMEFDLVHAAARAAADRLIVNPQTGRIDFSLAGTPLPDDCATQHGAAGSGVPVRQWLQTLNGFPTVTPASAPATRAAGSGHGSRSGRTWSWWA